MSTDNSSPEWAIENILADETGLEFYLKEYKPFRLTALREDPQGMSAPLQKPEVREW
jgi:hypothetical protein